MANSPCAVYGLQHCLEGEGEKISNIDFERLNYRRFSNYHLKDLELGGLSNQDCIYLRKTNDLPAGSRNRCSKLPCEFELSLQISKLRGHA